MLSLKGCSTQVYKAAEHVVTQSHKMMNTRFVRQLADFKGLSDDAFAFGTLESIGLLNEIELSINLKFDSPILVDYEDEDDNWTRSRKYYELGDFYVKATTNGNFYIIKAATEDKPQPGYLQTKVKRKKRAISFS